MEEGLEQLSPQELFDKYLTVVRRLRKDCPWDREQTHESIRNNLIEEAYEVVESIDEKNLDELKKELGDLLLHVVLHSVIAEEEQAFTVSDVLSSSMEKLIRRHPHVFGDAPAGSAHEVKVNWEKLKRAEGRQSILDGVPKEMPSLLRSLRLQEKASKVGFDWKNKQDVWSKVEEELEELRSAEETGVNPQIDKEYGDLLFAIVNYGRFLNINPELSLKHAAEKFLRRFRFVEQELLKKGKSPEHSSLEEMDELWNKGKESIP